MYIGVNNVARKISNCYVGVNGVARKVKAVYVGVNGVARLVWQSIKTKFTSYASERATTSFSQDYANSNAAIHKMNNNHMFFSATTRMESTIDFIYNIKLDDNGNIISKHARTVHSDSYNSSFVHDAIQVNDKYWMLMRGSSGSAGSSCEILLLYENNGAAQIASSCLMDQFSSGGCGFIGLGNGRVLAVRRSSGFYYATIFECSSDGKLSVLKKETDLTYKYGGAYPSSVSPSILFELSNNRFAIIHDFNTSPMLCAISIYGYSIDSSGTANISLLRTHVFDYRNIFSCKSIGEDAGIFGWWDNSNSTWVAQAFKIDSNNNISFSTTTNCNEYRFCRIGTSNSVICNSSDRKTYNIIYYDMSNNTLSVTGSGSMNYISALPYKEDSIIYLEGDSSKSTCTIKIKTFT